MKRNKNNTTHYTWGANCSGWHLLQSKGLSVIEELMPPATQEQKHYHTNSQQFFYILKGTATFVIEEETIEITSGSGIHIQPMKKHLIKNNTSEALAFLVISQPPTTEDRVNI